jgi:hypothetical protein
MIIYGPKRNHIIINSVRNRFAELKALILLTVNV